MRTKAENSKMDLKMSVSDRVRKPRVLIFNSLKHAIQQATQERQP